ncbi:lachesin-like [Daktulosphaira vitifoliae]|uniref:lachesin-like n=1 Tax=Daktulosphaira vitifoliae TaxID=58002 RepID=UPI0021AADD5D|nr:lachesin-like [Daktulosphaira vitifoliae]
MKILIKMFIVFNILNVWGQRTPTITHITQKPIKDIGGTVELTCSVLYSQDFPVMWAKVNKDKNSEPFVISMGGSLVLKDTRFELIQRDDSFTLQIRDIQETDAGVYQCQISMGLKSRISAEVELEIRRPPIISDNSTRSLLVNEGQPVKLECYAGGFPVPRISWRRVNNGILPAGRSIYRGNILYIPAITKEDRGTYYCIAENGVGRGARRNIAVEVQFAPVITVPRPRLGQALQNDMDLECHVEAYPPPAITWLNNGVQLLNNQHHRITHFASADDFTDTTLRIITVEKRQYGDYMCRASNVLGTTEAVVHLYETIIPVCPPACG